MDISAVDLLNNTPSVLDAGPCFPEDGEALSNETAITDLLHQVTQKAPSYFSMLWIYFVQTALGQWLLGAGTTLQLYILPVWAVIQPGLDAVQTANKMVTGWIDGWLFFWWDMLTGIVSVCWGVSTLTSIMYVVVVYTAVRTAWGLFKYVSHVRSLHGIPRPRRASILWGHTPCLMQNAIHHYIAEQHRKLGPVFVLRLIHKYMVFVCHPEALVEIFKKDGSEKAVEAYKPLDALISMGTTPNLLTQKTSSAMWKAVRKGVAPAFALKNLRRVFPLMVEVVDQMVDVLKQQGSEAVIDIDLAAQREALDVIGLVGFGTRFNSIQSLQGGMGERVLKALQEGLEEVEKRYRAPYRDWLIMRMLPDVQEGRRKLEAVQKVVREVYEQARAGGQLPFNDPTIWGHLSRVRDPDTHRHLTDQQLQAETGILFFAGMETTGRTIAFVLYCVSQNPAVEDKILAELKSLGLLATKKTAARQMEFDDVAGLRYLDCVVKETMRMYPVIAGGSGRIALRPIKIGDHVLPTGTLICVPFYALHNSPDLWAEPEKFVPERWEEPDQEYMPETKPATASTIASHPLDEPIKGRFLRSRSSKALSKSGGGSPVTPRARRSTGLGEGDGDGDVSGRESRPRRFAPFAHGPRACVGLSMAHTNVVATCAQLLANFHFVLAEEMGGPEGVRAKERLLTTLQIVGGMKMHAIPRRGA